MRGLLRLVRDGMGQQLLLVHGAAFSGRGLPTGWYNRYAVLLKSMQCHSEKKTLAYTRITMLHTVTLNKKNKINVCLAS